MKSDILYIKFATESVITDLPTFFNLNYREYNQVKDCYLRLIAHGMENCPHNCVYCYANYAYDVPTTVIINFKDKLKENIERQIFSKLISDGFPINIGSITDPFNRVATYFNLVKDALEVTSNANFLIVTKCIDFTEKNWIKFLKNYKNLKITYTYTGLSKFELGFPYGNKKFPVREISRAIESGLDINIFYRPIIEGENDDKLRMEKLFLNMKNSGIKHVCIGFLRSNERMRNSLSNRFPEQFRKITKNLTNKYMDDFYPPLEYRIMKLLEIQNLLYHNGLDISTCQPYVGTLRNVIETTYCSCRKERWGK